MHTILLTALIVLFLLFMVLLISIIAVMALSAYGSFIAAAPFVPVRSIALTPIVDALKLTSGSVLYDLGCGEGRVLAAALLRHPDIRAIGLEIGPWPRLLARLRLRRYGTRASILNQDFFTAPLEGATHIYVYLYDRVLAQLEPHFDTVLRPGTRVVSCDFTFPHKTPDAIIDIPHPNIRAKKLYIYTW